MGLARIPLPVLFPLSKFPPQLPSLHLLFGWKFPLFLVFRTEPSAILRFLFSYCNISGVKSFFLIIIILTTIRCWFFFDKGNHLSTKTKERYSTGLLGRNYFIVEKLSLWEASGFCFRNFFFFTFFTLRKIIAITYSIVLYLIDHWCQHQKKCIIRLFISEIML